LNAIQALSQLSYGPPEGSAVLAPKDCLGKGALHPSWQLQAGLAQPFGLAGDNPVISFYNDQRWGRQKQCLCAPLKGSAATPKPFSPKPDQEEAMPAALTRKRSLSDARDARR
jgi:hypothetical protein